MQWTCRSTRGRQAPLEGGEDGQEHFTMLTIAGVSDAWVVFGGGLANLLSHQGGSCNDMA
jgi:hypothetical protein